MQILKSSTQLSLPLVVTINLISQPLLKTTVPGGVDIENTAGQVVHLLQPNKLRQTEIPTKPTEKRVNSVPVKVEFNFTKRLEGRELKANEFSFQLKDEAGKCHRNC